MIYSIILYSIILYFVPEGVPGPPAAAVAPGPSGSSWPAGQGRAEADVPS